MKCLAMLGELFMGACSLIGRRVDWTARPSFAQSGDEASLITHELR
jgi:hypothetical protein